MVTEISGAGLGHSVVSQTGAGVAQRIVEAGSPGNLNALSEVGASDKQASSASQVVGAYAQLRGQQDTLSKAASVVREVGNTVEQAGQLLGKMENKLGEIVKMYPPYPIDNPQRVSLLNSIGDMRKEIAALTYPPPEAVDAVSRVLGSHADVAGKEGGASAKPDTVAAVKVQLEDIPPLDPRAASDAEVAKALDQVKAAKLALKEVQTGIWNDVAGFVKQANSPEVQSQGSGTREQLADVASLGIGSNPSQFTQAVESK